MTILLWLVAALGVVCIMLAILYIVVRLRNSALAKDLSVTRNQKDNLMRENVHLQDALDTARKQRDELNRENESLHQANKNIVTQNADVHAQNADLREALQEAQAEIKALQMNTIEVPEVTPEPVKRTRKKAGQA